MQDSEYQKEKRINQTEEHSRLQDSNNKITNIEIDDDDDNKGSKTKWIIIGSIAVVVLVLVIVLPITLTKKNKDGGIKLRPFSPPGPPPTPIPNSFYNYYQVGVASNNQDSYSGFIVSDSSYNAQLHSQILNKLYNKVQASNGNHDFGINARTLPQGINNQYINNVSFFFGMPDYKVAYLEMTDALNPRYTIPSEYVGGKSPNTAMRLEMLGFQLQNNPFSFSFTDVTDKTNVFLSTEKGSLVFMDKFIQLDFQLPSQRVYGLGERIHEFGLGEGTWTMWAKGQDSPYDDGTGGKQVYGVHPFALIQGKNKGDYFGIWFRNSNAQSPLLTFNADGTSTLTYITIGGRLEAYFFIHGSAREIIQSYQNIIGNPSLPPFWSLGWGQGSQKYLKQDDIETMIKGYKDSSIPLETVYLDVSYLLSYPDFTVDTTAYPDLKTLANTLHANNQKLVLVLKVGIAADGSPNKYFNLAQDLNVLIQSTINSASFNGAAIQYVTSQREMLLDWFHKDIQQLWGQGLNDLFAQVPFDGLWIDQNEVTGICAGECPLYAPSSTITVESFLRQLSEKQPKAHPELQDPVTSWYTSIPNQNQQSTFNLPFIPGQVNLDDMTLSLNATHPSNGETEYNLHNLYGHMMSWATNTFLTSDSIYTNTDNRPFVLSRSTFSGTGKYASHWLGRNWKNYGYMKYSIAGMMNMNMFGIPHVGAEVCGFYGQTPDDEMCARWIQLSTFYPLARAYQNQTYNGYDNDGQEPYTLAQAYKTKAQASIFDRYQYLRHMYTCLFEANQFGGSCIEPLFYYFPDDDNCYTNYEESFMVGGAIKVSPILQAGVASKGAFTSYFPAGNWVNLLDYSVVVGGKQVTLTEQDTVNSHLKPGGIIGFQDNKLQIMSTTADLLKAPISLIINRDSNQMASGSLLLDQGISRAEISGNQYEYFKLTVSSNSINKLFAQGTLGSQKVSMDKVVIVNAQDLQAVNFACYMDNGFNPVAMAIAKDSTAKTLTLTPTTGNTILFSDFKTIHFGNSAVDINLCDPLTYTYKLKTGTLPSLTGSTATFVITNKSPNVVLPDIKVTLKMITPDIVNVFWTFNSQPSGQRVPFQVPKSIITPTTSAAPSSLSNFVVITSDPFVLTLKSVSGTSVLDFKGEIYSSWLNIIKARAYLASGTQFTGIFGLGERVQTHLPYDDGVYSMYSRDATTPTETGKVPGNNVYGTFPFYMFKTDVGIWTGVHTNLAQAQDWYVKNDLTLGVTDLTTVSIGGVVDIYIILGYSPKQVIQNYWNYVIGKPVLVPLYSLGWNQCRWGYHTTQDLMDVVGNYSANGIPLDVQWSDIDYLDTYRDFTVDQSRFSDLPAFIDTLHANNMHYVPILDAGIAMRPNGNYAAYDSGIQQGIFIKANSGLPNEPFVGSVWPNEAVYPDWFNPSTGTWWQQQLQVLHDTIAFDGLWLDMNEASNFCAGPCKRSQLPASSVLMNLKYIPTNRDLQFKSIGVDAYQYGNVLQIDSHNLYGTMEIIQTYNYFMTQNKRPFIIERSGFSGLGKYASKWLGDNFSDLNHFESSITGTMMMGMFGIPLVGADICGLLGNTNAELCARWTVAGAFYPFSRNHNDYTSISQEPYQFANDFYEDGVSYMSIMTQGIRNKYHLIKYYYTYIYLGNQYGTGPIFNSMWFTFEDDTNAYNDPQYNIMLGPALKLSVLTDKLGQNTTSFYFPLGTWCNVFTPTEKCFTNTKGAYKDYQSKAYNFYVHLYSGNIAVMQDATALNVMKVYDLQQHPVDLHILGTQNLEGTNWYAQGSYVNDDGMTTTLTGNVNEYAISAMVDTLNPQFITITFTQTQTAYNYNNTVGAGCSAVNANDYIGTIYIYNGQQLGLLGAYIANFYYENGVSQAFGRVIYDEATDRLVFNYDTSKGGDKNMLCMTRIKKIQFSNLGHE